MCDGSFLLSQGSQYGAKAYGASVSYIAQILSLLLKSISTKKERPGSAFIDIGGCFLRRDISFSMYLVLPIMRHTLCVPDETRLIPTARRKLPARLLAAVVRETLARIPLAFRFRVYNSVLPHDKSRKGLVSLMTLAWVRVTEMSFDCAAPGRDRSESPTFTSAAKSKHFKLTRRRRHRGVSWRVSSFAERPKPSA